MTSKELIKEYFKGGNAVNISYPALKSALQVIKEMGDKLDKEMEEKGIKNNFKPDSLDPRDSNK